MMTPSMPHSTHFWQKASKPNCMMGLRYPIKDERDADIATDVAQLFEKQAEGHAVAQGAGGSILDDNAVGHGVTERNSDFNHIDSVFFEGADNVGSTVEVWDSLHKSRWTAGSWGCSGKSWLIRFIVSSLLWIYCCLLRYRRVASCRQVSPPLIS